MSREQIILVPSTYLATGLERDAQADDGAKAIWPHHHSTLGGIRSPIMADENGGLDVERVQQTQQITHRMKRAVLVTIDGA